MKPPLFLSIIFCCLIFGLLLLFCAQPDRPKGIVIQNVSGVFNPYESDKNHFSINLPVDWEVKEYGSNTLLIASAPILPDSKESEAYRENLQIDILPLSTVFNFPATKSDSIPAFNLNALARWFFEDLQLKTNDYKVIEIGETLINGKHAAQFLYSYNNPQEYNDELKAISFVLIQAPDVVLATCTESSGTFNKKRKIFEYMTQSLRFTAI